MKCQNCGEEMIDIKDYCVNCGKKLREYKGGISLYKLLLIFLGIIIVTIFVCYLIINLNTDKEIAPFLNKDVIEKTDN